MVAADKGYSSKDSRAYLRRRGIKAVIPERAGGISNRKKRGRSGGRPPAFDAEAYRDRNPVLAVALPFVLADQGTLRVAAFRIPNAASSSLRLLGVTDATPPWDRPVQLALGLALGVFAVRAGRWRAAVMLAAAIRIALDPQVYSYNTASVLLGALIWDIQMRPGRTIPVWTWTVFGALFGSRYLPLAPTTLGVLRLSVCLTVIVCALWAPGLLARISPQSRPSTRTAASAAAAEEQFT